MNKYKICVYAICKNEEQFVDRWCESMKEADEIIVLDTGSTDKTIEKLKAHNVKVYQKIISPWRFDVARNESLKLIPDYIDFCCCVDLDEVFVAGWRDKLEKCLDDDVARVSYRYTWNFDEFGNEGIVFFADKIHRNKYFEWEHPVHETLKQLDFSKTKHITIETLQLNHHADNTKSRSSYLPLLELSVKEDPTSDRNMHYLGREYYFYGEYEKAIKTLKKHLLMPNSLWQAERSSSCSIIANCYEKLNNNKMAKKYHKLAISESPQTREAYIEFAKFSFRQKNYLDVVVIISACLNIKNRELNYMTHPDCWSSLPYDIMAISYYFLKDYKKAVKYGKLALNYFPNDERLISNFNIYCSKLKI